MICVKSTSHLSLNDVNKFSKVIDNYANSNLDERAQKRLKCLDFYEANFNNILTLADTVNLFKF